jgi:hypothetical protein
MWFSLLLAAGLGWVDLGDGRFALRAGGKDVAVYNSAPLLPAGVPEDRRRCCYLFPVYTPGGVAMLDDFPKDHYHHRGVFWGWPVVETPAGTFDIWMMKGIAHRTVGKVRTRGAVLEVENGWFAGDRRVVTEQVKIVGQGTGRFRVELALTAVDGPVTLRGSTDQGKSYGGFSARFGPREGTRIASNDGPVTKDEDLVKHAWAELSALYGGREATLRITPDEPTQWCLRHYGFVGASLPGREGGEALGLTLAPGRTVRMGFTVAARDGSSGR